ncbi:MAG TPA: mycothiol synthase [Nocardioidaceae bacterium]|nr:mycothiol synthase [Nocardioidaceae bacterium]
MPVRRDPPDWEQLVRRVAAEATQVDGHAPVNEAALLGLEHHGLTDTTVYADDEGFALVHDGALHLVVAPHARRQGRGTRLLEAAEGVTTAWSHGDHPAARALAASHGFERVRELWLMRRPAGPVAPSPTDVTIRSFVPGDEEAFLAANAAAFADHPEQGSLSREDLRHRMAEPWFDPAGFFLAEEAGELLGYHWTKIHPDGTGEVYVVGVTPAAQGRGLGRALVVHGLDHLQPRDVVLYVESENTAAIALYQSLGFEHVASDAQYRKWTSARYGS